MMNHHRHLLLHVAFLLGVGTVFSAGPESVAVGERGNWVKKREWVKQAQVANDDLQRDVIAIQKSRTPFYTEFEALDGHSNTFYQTKGFARGKINDLVADLRADIAQEKEARIKKAKSKAESDDMPVNYYDVQIEAIEDDVRRFDREVEQFKLDMVAIGDVDSSLSERLKVLDKHIKQAGESGVKGAQVLEQMWWMIDDNKARTAYYEIKGHAEHVASVRKYIEGPLMQDFKQVGETLKKQIAQVQTQIDDLEQRGLVVEHRSQRLLQKKRDVEREEKLAAQEIAEQEQASQPRRRQRRKQTASIFSYVYAPIGWVLNLGSMVGRIVVAPFNYVLSFFTGKNSKPVRARRRLAVEQDQAVEQLSSSSNSGAGGEDKPDKKDASSSV